MASAFCARCCSTRSHRRSRRADRRRCASCQRSRELAKTAKGSRSSRATPHPARASKEQRPSAGQPAASPRPRRRPRARTAQSEAPARVAAAGSKLVPGASRAAAARSTASWSSRASAAGGRSLAAVMDSMYRRFRASRSQGSFTCRLGAFRVSESVEREDELTLAECKDRTEDTALEEAPVLTETSERSLTWDTREAGLATADAADLAPLSSLQASSTRGATSPAAFAMGLPPLAGGGGKAGAGGTA
mmetsp:Transcript_30553/g.97678  ORF Transcript_30553/g.97678 Transcript_30553/m.97678 type:complete len:248 (-) Transcript_30553:86-829(-)